MLSLPLLPSAAQLFDAQGKPTSVMQQYWQQFADAIQSNVNGIEEALTQAGIALNIANEALAAASGPTTQTVPLGATLTKKLDAGASVALDGIAYVQAGGTNGNINVAISGGPSGGAMATLATSANDSVGPSEPGDAEVTYTFTNTTGMTQIFDFTLALNRVPTGAGGSLIASQSYLTG